MFLRAGALPLAFPGGSGRGFAFEATREYAQFREVLDMNGSNRASASQEAAAERRGLRTSEAVVREFWRLMATNDFHAVKAVLAPEFVLEWPQSNERIRGPENFARMNAEYPAAGRWQFRIHRLVASADEVVTQVSVTDGTQSAEAVSFFNVADRKIARLVEYWPEPYSPPQNRRHLTEPIA